MVVSGQRERPWGSPTAFAISEGPLRSAPGRSRQVGSFRRSTAKAWRPSWPPSETATPTDVVPWPRYRSLAPIVAGSGRTSPLGPFRAALGETSIRSITTGHLLGRHQSLETRPALDGRSAGRSPTLADAKRRVKPLSERSLRRPRKAPALQHPHVVAL